AREEHDLPHLPQSVPGQRRRDEAVRAVCEVPGARVSGEARSEPASRDAAQPSALKTAARAAVAAGLTAYILWRSHPREVLTAVAAADWRLIAVAVVLVLADRALMAYRWVALLCIVDPRERPPFAEIMRVFFVSTFVGTFL